MSKLFPDLAPDCNLLNLLLSDHFILRKLKEIYFTLCPLLREQLLWVMNFCTTFQPSLAGSGDHLLSGSTLLLALKMTYKASNAEHRFEDYYIETENMNLMQNTNTIAKNIFF